MKKCEKRENNFWRLIAKSLGEKSGKNNSEADRIAIIRLLMFSSIFITNCFIVAGVVRHWNDVYVQDDGQINTNKVQFIR